MPDELYFKLNDDVGVEPDVIAGPGGLPEPNPRAGELGPLKEAPGFVVHVPSKDPATGGIVMKTKRVKPTVTQADPRAVHTSDPQVIDGINQSGLFHQIDPPKPPASKKED